MKHSAEFNAMLKAAMKIMAKIACYNCETVGSMKLNVTTQGGQIDAYMECKKCGATWRPEALQ